MRTFTSQLSPYMRGLIQEKQASGFSYVAHEYYFKQFDTFIMENGFDTGVLGRELVVAWSNQRSTEGGNHRNSRVSKVRQLAKYMMSLGIDAYIPKDLASTASPVPYLPTAEERKAFFHIVDSWKPRNVLSQRFSCEYPVLFRLYYCCGLRLSEAIQLKREDVNWETGRLYIRHSKGDKDRNVYAAADVLSLMRRYDEKMHTFIPHRAWFFPGWNAHRPFQKSSIDKKFQEFWNLTPYAIKESKRPTVNSFRHCFVVDKINEWAAQKRDIENLMPYLSKYLGHSGVSQTYYYYHQFDAFTPAVRNYIEQCNGAVPEVFIHEEE